MSCVVAHIGGERVSGGPAYGEKYRLRTRSDMRARALLKRRVADNQRRKCGYLRLYAEATIGDKPAGGRLFRALYQLLK